MEIHPFFVLGFQGILQLQGSGVQAFQGSIISVWKWDIHDGLSQYGSG